MQGMDMKTGKAISSVEHLRQSITNILTTPLGSRIMRRDFGSRLFSRIDAPLNGELIGEIYSDVIEAIFNFEPRFEISNVSVVEIKDGKIILDLEGKYLPTGENIILNNIEIQRQE